MKHTKRIEPELPLMLEKPIMKELIEILDNIRKDLEDYNTDNYKGDMTDIEKRNLFERRIAASVISYEELYL